MAVSREQMGYLREAESAWESKDILEVIRTIHHVIRDSHIRTGREELHESWADIWDRVEERARSLAPSDIIAQIDEAIAKIPRTDKSLWQLRLSEKQSIVILLGAGASKPAPSNIPVVGEFLPELW